MVSITEPTAMKSVRFSGPVSDAMKEKEQGKDGNYELVLQKIKNPFTKSEDLLDVLQQFREVVHVIDKSKVDFVVGLTAAKWALREKEVIQSYFNVLVNLASANSIHVVLILKCLFKHFVPRYFYSKNDSLLTPRDEIFELTHATFRRIFTLIPMSISLAKPLLSMTYPFMTKDIDDLECNMKNLFKMTEYAPSLRRHILELVVSKTLQIDLICTREAIQEKNTDADEVLFEMDMDKPDKNEFVEKLDSKLNIILQYVQNTCFEDGKLTKIADNIFDDMLYVFRKVILPVHDSSHVQFILFYMCSFKVDYQKKFASLLWEIAIDPNSPVLKRQITLCYIASFHARAKFLKLEDALNAINSLSQWIHSYINDRGLSGGYGDGLHNAYRHGVFYAACQTLFYIIIFRVKEIMNLTDGSETMRKIQIERIITSQLNPLNFCINTVVDLFSSSMRQHQIALCDTIVKKNNRQYLPISGDPATRGSINPLDSFFPFDPYILKLSMHLFKDIYQPWDGPAPNVEESDDDDDDNNEDSDDELMELTVGSPDPFSDKNQLKGIDISSKVFGISPGFSLITASPY